MNVFKYKLHKYVCLIGILAVCISLLPMGTERYFLFARI